MKTKKIITYVAVIALVGAMIYAFILLKKVFTPNTNFEQEKVYVYIPSDATSQQVMDSLKTKVKDWDIFYKIFTQLDMDHKMIPGKFELKKGMNNYEIAQALKRNIPVKVTYNNLERIEDLANLLGDKLEPTAEEFYRVLTDSTFLADSDVKKEEAIALYMPNTYEYYWNTTAVKVRNNIQKQYVRFWNDERRQKAKALGYTPAEVVSLAAIVQKESSKVEERPKIAGVYLNRLKANMPLQADPTVIYAKKMQLNNFDTIIKRVYLKDLLIDNPYNTYKYSGITPGAIFMPDEVSIDAVLNAEKHDYLFFCASVERFGYHEFARNMAEHAVNRKKYTDWLNKNNIQ